MGSNGASVQEIVKYTFIRNCFPNVFEMFLRLKVSTFSRLQHNPCIVSFCWGFTTGDVAKREYVSQVQLALL